MKMFVLLLLPGTNRGKRWGRPGKREGGGGEDAEEEDMEEVGMTKEGVKTGDMVRYYRCGDPNGISSRKKRKKYMIRDFLLVI